jgi:hypothetical protein
MMKATCIFLLVLRLVNGASVHAVDWADLNLRLMQTIRSEHRLVGVTNDPYIQGLITNNNVSALTEICFQHQYPSLVIAGFLGIERIKPVGSYSIALRAAWNADEDELTQLLPVIHTYLSNHIDETVFRTAFSHVMSIPPRSWSSATLAVQQIDMQSLRNWFDQETDTGLSSCPPSNISLVLERLCLDNTERKVSYSPRLALQLASYKNVLGYPQIIFLCFYPSEDADLKNIMRMVIEDEKTSPDNLYTLVTHRTELIKTMLNGKQLRLTDKRLQSIRRILDSMK